MSERDSAMTDPYDCLREALEALENVLNRDCVCGIAKRSRPCTLCRIREVLAFDPPAR